MSSASNSNTAQQLAGKRVAFVGKLGGFNRREAQQLVRRHGAIAVERPSTEVDFVVIGADELPLGDQEEELLDQAVRQAAAEGKLEILTETQLWQRLGLVEAEQNVRRLYTPAMLADLLGVSVATVRRWRRRGLIVPVREVHRLPYFDFQEIATARRLAQLLAAGASPAAIEKKLEMLARFVPEVERPLAQLSVIVEGKQLLLRQGEGLIEPGGQMRIDFDALESNQNESQVAPSADEAETVGAISFQERTAEMSSASPSEILDYAGQLEDEGQLQSALEMYRVALASSGPKAEICFQLAELLYRVGDLSAARERYYMAIELDEDYVEARANLGCVLSEMGQSELAAAAFQGALKHHSDYPDAHYHLAQVLDDLGRCGEAEEHWQRFLQLTPESPWAEQAQIRLSQLSN